jgi:hypothetical protein
MLRPTISSGALPAMSNFRGEYHSNRSNRGDVCQPAIFSGVRLLAQLSS